MVLKKFQSFYQIARKAFYAIKGRKRIYLIGAPFHSNMGDQAQTACSVQWFNKFYPHHRVVVLESVEVNSHNYFILKVIKLFLKSDDRIFLHSGYHTTDLYPIEEHMQETVVEMFPHNKIVLLPQTILFEKEEAKKRAAEIFNKHPNLTILCRDNISYDAAKEIFYNCNLLCYPDIVTTLIGTTDFSMKKRNGILFCMRNDQEAYYKKDQIEILQNKLNKYGHVDMTDTTIDMDVAEIRQDRMAVLRDIFEEYSNYKLIITDRYHGTIFSMIAATPVIVLGTTDHKLSSGVKWFPDEFKDYIHFVDSIDCVENLADKILNMKYSYVLPQYFNTEFYDKLFELLEN